MPDGFEKKKNQVSTTIMQILSPYEYLLLKLKALCEHVTPGYKMVKLTLHFSFLLQIHSAYHLHQ